MVGLSCFAFSNDAWDRIFKYHRVKRGIVAFSAIIERKRALQRGVSRLSSQETYILLSCFSRHEKKHERNKAFRQNAGKRYFPLFRPRFSGNPLSTTYAYRVRRFTCEFNNDINFFAVRSSVFRRKREHSNV